MAYLMKTLLVFSLLGTYSAYLINRIWPSKDIVNDELTSHINGTVVRPWDSDYYDAIMQKTLDFVRRPGAIVFVQNRDDIRKCILFAKKHSLGVAMRSSGHSFFGRSTADHVLLIDTSKMNKILSINVNDPESDTGSSATVEAGTTWGDIYEEVDNHKLVAVGPSPLSVSVSGFLLGGGHSPLTRMFGIGSDNVLRISLVSANGDYVQCTETNTFVEKVNGDTETLQNGDLFWALRGGGAAFGVITEFKLKLHPAPDQLVHMTSSMTIEHPVLGEPWKDFLGFYADFMHTLPKNWGGYIMPNNLPAYDPFWNVTALGVASISMLHFGNWTEAIRSIQPFLDFNPIQKVYAFTNHSSFWSYNKNSHQGMQRYVYMTSRFVHAEDFQRDELTELLTEELMEGFQYRGCTIIQIGGRAAEIPASTSAVSANFRRALWNLVCSPGYDDPRDRDFQLQQFQPFRRKMYTVGEGAYYNEADHNLDKWQEEFWGDHYDRLQEIKENWDPNNFFTCHMCVEAENDE